MEKLTLAVEGMSCENCVKSIETNVGAMTGVDTVAVSLEQKTVAIIFDASQTTQTTIADAIESLGFDVK